MNKLLVSAGAVALIAVLGAAGLFGLSKAMETTLSQERTLISSKISASQQNNSSQKKPVNTDKTANNAGNNHTVQSPDSKDNPDGNGPAEAKPGEIQVSGQVTPPGSGRPADFSGKTVVDTAVKP